VAVKAIDAAKQAQQETASAAASVPQTATSEAASLTTQAKEEAAAPVLPKGATTEPPSSARPLKQEVVAKVATQEPVNLYLPKRLPPGAKPTALSKKDVARQAAQAQAQAVNSRMMTSARHTPGQDPKTRAAAAENVANVLAAVQRAEAAPVTATSAPTQTPAPAELSPSNRELPISDLSPKNGEIPSVPLRVPAPDSDLRREMAEAFAAAIEVPSQAGRFSSSGPAV